MKRILIIGAGFCGLTAAQYLAKRLKNESEILLISDQEDFVFQPQLIEALEEKLPEADLHSPLSQLVAKWNIQFLQGRASRIDRRAKTVEILLPSLEKSTLPYDELVLASGATTADYGIPGVLEYTLPFKTLVDLRTIKNRLQMLANRAKESSDPSEIEKLLRIAVIGAGPTGVELAFAICGRMRHELRTHPKLAKQIQIHLFHALPRILTGFPLSCVTYAEKSLIQSCIVSHTGMRVIRVESGKLLDDSGKTWEINTLLWCAGVRPQYPEISDHPPENGIKVDATLRLDAHLFCGGDVASMTDRQLVIPKNGQTARLMGTHIAKNVIATIRNQPLKSFHFSTKGSILVLGETACFEGPFGILLRGTWLLPFRRLFYKLMHKSMMGF